MLAARHAAGAAGVRAPFLEYGGASSSLTASELQAYVPDLIVERVEAGQLDGLYVSEHRKLVSVFLKVIGLGRQACERSRVCARQEELKRQSGALTFGHVRRAR